MTCAASLNSVSTCCVQLHKSSIVVLQKENRNRREIRRGMAMLSAQKLQPGKKWASATARSQASRSHRDTLLIQVRLCVH